MSYPCALCNLDCIGYREIGCEHCDKWYHFSCENLKVKDFTFLSKTTLPYICSKCTYYSSSKQFNYDMALERLTVAARADRLEEAIKLELVFLPKELSTVTSPTNTISFRNLRTDAISSRLLGQTWDKTIPITVSADGNCLFNALSVALFGHEHVSSEIKVKTCIEMTLNESFYTNAHSVTNIPLVSGSFEESKLDCAINGRYSSSWIIHAASTVVSRPIKSVYPVANGPVDGYIGILNTTFRPRISKSSNELVIMCTHSNTATSSSNNWAPNHFVPLVPKEDASKKGGEYCKKVFHFP